MVTSGWFTGNPPETWSAVGTRWRDVTGLHEAQTAATGDQLGAPGWQRDRPDVAAQELALFARTGQQQPRGADLPEPADQAVHHAAGRAGGGSGDHQVQPDVLALGQQVQQRQQRVGPPGDEVVVVDEQEQPRALPPVPPG